MGEETGGHAQAHGWLSVLEPWLERGTPVTLLVLLVLGGLTLWFQAREVERVHDSQTNLVQLLLAAKDEQVKLALRIGNCEGRSAQQRQDRESWPDQPRLWPVPVWHREERVCP